MNCDILYISIYGGEDMTNLNVLDPKQLTGGEFNQIRVFDQLTVEDQLKCQLIEIYQEAIFNGSLDTKVLQVMGIATFLKKTTAIEINIQGSAYFYQDVNTNHLKVKNEITVKNGKLCANQIELEGIAHIDSLDTAHLMVNGTIYSKSVIRSQNIEFKEKVTGDLNEVIGSMIHIHPKNNQLSINSLLAYEVHLDNVSINTLKAKNIHLGKNCNIKHIEYL